MLLYYIGLLDIRLGPEFLSMNPRMDKGNVLVKYFLHLNTMQ